ncbi:insulin-degrading enzyme [Platysternon megacephalum]|uniref:Insulin-degrading enzyme n=1 Tax=Platysternon megacephalum TaxID=55544 RepID=A0A4D9EA96_9SAUR|nr:insulin-degrading enzyme [Platysternon megacephalum]
MLSGMRLSALEDCAADSLSIPAVTFHRGTEREAEGGGSDPYPSEWKDSSPALNNSPENQALRPDSPPSKSSVLTTEPPFTLHRRSLHRAAKVTGEAALWEGGRERGHLP